MARTFGKGYGRNNVVATGSDSGDQVSVNAWNDDKDAGGMLGFTSSTKTIASGKITPVDTVTIVAAEAGTADNLDLITYSDTMENDIFYLFADAGDTITVRHNQTPASGEAAIITTSAANVTLSETIPLVLQRRGTTLYQIIENSISSVTAGSTTTFTNKSIDLTDNTLTGTSLELKTAISDETGSGSLVFATSPTLVTPVLGQPASGNLTDCTFPTLNQSTTGNAATATALATGRTIGGTSFDGTGNITPANITVADTTNTTCSVALFESATGDLPPKSDAGITYNAGTGTLTATGFAGPLTGNVTGNASGTAATVTGSAQTAITSVGTLTALAVDNITIDTNKIEATNTNGNIQLDSNGTGVIEVLGNTNDGAITLNCTANTHSQTIKSQPHSAAVTNTMLLPEGASSTLVSLVSTDTLTNKTLTSPTLTGTVTTAAVDVAGNNIDNIQNLIHDTSATTTALDFSGDQLQTISISADTTFTTSNGATGKSKTIKITTDATLRTLTFPAWKFVGAKPADQAASKIGILTITCFGATDADIIAAYAVEE
jgi:hypothetical protein